ncbi:MAG TPA: sugar phosphate nucleotidyltransferase [Candidatus Angelobacter sp.]|nr:sugar phosphate nucleotidyltransferase [Candidatus Angelobacter sp.]
MKKAVILARGLGSRMRQSDAGARLGAEQEAVAQTGLKAMIPFERPFLDYVLSGLADAGYREVCVVIGPEHGAVERHYGLDAPPRRMQIAFAIQQEAKGTANAVLSVEEFAGGEDFICINSDNYYPTSALRELRELGEAGVVLFDRATLIAGGNISAEKLRKFSICEVSEDGYLRAIVEKPPESMWSTGAANPLISMNCWRFDASVFEVCRRAPLSPRGEYELPVAVGEAIRNQGLRLRVVRCYEGVLDLSSRADIASVAEKLRGISANP